MKESTKENAMKHGTDSIMSTAQDTLENRLEQAYCLITTLIMSSGEAENADMTSRLMSGALWSAQELVGQARDAFREMTHERKPDAPIKFDSEDLVRTLKEALALTEHGNDLIRSARAILLGQPDPIFKEANA